MFSVVSTLALTGTNSGVPRQLSGCRSRSSVGRFTVDSPVTVESVTRSDAFGFAASLSAKALDTNVPSDPGSRRPSVVADLPPAVTLIGTICSATFLSPHAVLKTVRLDGAALESPPGAGALACAGVGKVQKAIAVRRPEKSFFFKRKNCLEVVELQISHHNFKAKMLICICV